MRARGSWAPWLLAVPLLVSACHGGAGPDEPAGDGAGLLVRESQGFMDTLFDITVLAEDGDEERAKAAIEKSFQRIAWVEQAMSAWRDDSQIAMINRRAGGEPVQVDGELFQLVERSLALCRQTGGLMDVTFRPLGLLWNFHREPFVMPSAEAIAAARDLVDCERLELDPEAGTIRLATPGMSVALGALAKGYAVDRASQALSQAGYANSLVNGGGDVMAKGTRGAGPWRVGIQHPRRPHGDLAGRVFLQDRALVTSGDYERFTMVDGRMLHHIIDPRTGWPAEGVMSVSVLAPGAELADALATALFVAGPEGAAAIQQVYPQVEVLMFQQDGGYWASAGFLQVAELDAVE